MYFVKFLRKPFSYNSTRKLLLMLLNFRDKCNSSSIKKRLFPLIKVLVSKDLTPSFPIIAYQSYPNS